MNWFYAQNGKQIGPVTPEELQRLTSVGEIDNTTLVWREGMAAWQPYGAVRPPGEAPPVLEVATCSVCQRRLPSDEVIHLLGRTVCAACKPTLVQGLREGATVGTANVWRSKDTVVMARAATLPTSCFKCGAPPQGAGLKRRLYWHHPAIYLTILASLLIYVIVALIVRKRADVTVNLCARHWQQRRLWLTVGWIVSLLGVATMVWGVVQESAYGFWGILALLVGICAGNFGARMTFASRIDDQHIWLKGAGSEFLSGLPEWRD